MSHALYRLGRLCARHPFRTLGVWLLASVLIIAMSGTFGRELEDSFEVPGLDSQIALDLLQQVLVAHRPLDEALARDRAGPSSGSSEQTM